jgi:NDP-sugar pyrophosphorylase family protein
VDAVVMAAGEGRRLRPLTERWPKPVLPIDGRPVLTMLMRELQAAGCEQVWLVSGHLAEQVEALAGDGSSFGVTVRRVRQPGVLGSADAVQRALAAGAKAPLLVSAADTLFGAGDVRRFAQAFAAVAAAGAVAVRTEPAPGPDRPAIAVSGGRVVRFRAGADGGGWTPAPLWGLRSGVTARLCRDRPPYELENAFRAAMEAGETVAAIEIGKTRDLTYPLDLVKENFPYLRAM